MQKLPGKPRGAKTLRAVIFDHSTLLVDASNAALLGELRNLLNNLLSRGLQIIVFSTHDQDINAGLRQRGLLEAHLVLTRADVGANKGSPRWIEMVTQHTGFQFFETIYVGNDRSDWLTAINSGLIYIHARWAPEGIGGLTAYIVEHPADVFAFVTHFLLTPPRWEYALDRNEHRLVVRSLLDASEYLPASNPTQFKLTRVFTYRNETTVGDWSARDLLMTHALTSLYVEGLIAPLSRFAVYPSSQVGEISDVLGDFIKTAVKVFHGYFRPDLLVRAAPGIDTSLERYRAKQEGRIAKVTFANQTDTVHIHSRQHNKLREKSIIVFDDFTTTGRSLEWARNLLYAAGAQRVVLVTVGKYAGSSPRYCIYAANNPADIEPFHLKEYETGQCFTMNEATMRRDPNAPEVLKRSFNAWKTNQPLI